MDRWYRIAFPQEHSLQFSAALQRIHDAQRGANWSQESSVFVTDDWIHLAGVPSIVIYFPPVAAEMFADLINELGGEACLKPLPFGLMVHGNWAARSLLEQ